MGGIAERRPANGCQPSPSKRHFPSCDTASFHLAPSQNQLPSADHLVWSALTLIESGTLLRHGARSRPKA